MIESIGSSPKNPMRKIFSANKPDNSNKENFSDQPINQKLFNPVVKTPTVEKKFFEKETSPIKMNISKPSTNSTFKTELKLGTDRAIISMNTQNPLSVQIKSTKFLNSNSKNLNVGSHNTEMNRMLFPFSVIKPSLRQEESRSIISKISKECKENYPKNPFLSRTQGITSIGSGLNGLMFDFNTNRVINLIPVEEELNEYSQQNGIDLEIEKGKCELVNFLIPQDRINDEAYKLLKIQKIKRSDLPEAKSVKKISEIIVYDSANELSNEEYNYNILCRKKKVHSVKKHFSSEIALYNPASKVKKYFQIFRDCEIGINRYWQAHLKATEHDDDVETDEEQYMCGQYYSRKHILLAIKLVSGELTMEEAQKAMDNDN